MEPNCCKDDTSKAGTLAAPSPSFNESLLSLSKDDFKKIDTNNSGSLSAQELKDARQSGNFDPAKNKAIDVIEAHVENSKIDVTLQGSRVQMAATLPSWHTADFAKKQLSKDDFKLIDSNGDDILDSKELKAAANNPKLDPMEKHAVDILSAQLDASLNDPLLALKGGVKNWHNEEHSVLKKAADMGATTPSVDLHLTDDQANGNVSVSKVDDRGNPTEIESSGAVSSIKYDANNRITDIETKVAYSPNEKPVINKIVYDDANNTQTITTKTDGTYESTTTTVNHLGKDGKVKQEDFSTQQGEWKQSTSTKFNDKGQIVSQTSPTEDGGRSVGTAEYDGDKRISTRTSLYDASGALTRESSTDLASKLTKINSYDEGKRTHAIEIDSTNSRKPHVTDTLFDKNGNVSEINAISFGKPYLVDKIVQTDANGKVNSAVAEWKMVSNSMGRLSSVQLTDPNGETKKLDANSTGEDRKLWRQIESKMYQHSKPIWHSSGVDEVSPGSYQLYVPANAPA